MERARWVIQNIYIQILEGKEKKESIPFISRYVESDIFC